MAAKDEKLKQLLEKLSRGEISVTRITPEHIELNAKCAAMEKQYRDKYKGQIEGYKGQIGGLIEKNKSDLKQLNEDKAAEISELNAKNEELVCQNSLLNNTNAKQKERIKYLEAENERKENIIGQNKEDIAEKNKYIHKFIVEREPSGTVVKIFGNVIAPIIIIIFAVLSALSIASSFVEITWTESTVFKYIRYVFAALSMIGVCLIVIPCAKGHPSKRKRAVGIISVFLITLLGSLIVYELLTKYWYIGESEPLDFIHSSTYTIILIVIAVVLISLITAFVVYNSVQERNYLKFPGFFRIVCIVLAVLVVSVGEGYILKSWLNSQSIYDVYNNGYYYSYNDDDTFTIVSYNGNSEDLIIPDEYDGSSVTAIRANAFSGNTSLVSVTIGDNITTIGDGAFSGCIMLTNVTIGEGVSYIGDSAFENCYKLVEINNLSSLVIRAGSSGNGGIGYYAKNVYTATEGESHLLTQDGCLFVYDSHSDYYLIGYSDSYTTLTLPNLTVSGSAIDYSIYMYAFYNNVNLIKVTISDSVTTIGEYAFYNCSSLKSVVVPDSVNSIGSTAFGGCSSLESITLPFVGSSADATNASSSTLFGYIFGTNSYTGGTSVTQYYSSYNVVTYYIPSTLTEVIISGGNILYGAFYGCSSLTSITIPDGVASIESRTFYNCSSLTSIVVPDSVNSIGSAAFGGCSSLVSMTLPFVGGSVKTSSDTYQYPFGYIFGTTSYTGGTATKQYYYSSSTSSTSYSTYYIPATLTTVTISGGNILYGAFYGCSSLTSITIPDGVASIESRTFYNCSSLTSIIVPDSVTSIGEGAFSGCSSLVSMTLPFVGGSVKNSSDAYQYLFGYIFGTTSYTGGTATKQYYYSSSTSSTTNTTYYIPATLTTVTITGGNILYCAFYNCKSLISITIPNSVTSIGDYAFYWCESLTSITIPDSVTSIGDTAFYYCTALESVTIGNSVTSIGDYVFSGCKSLTSITIPDSVTSIGDDAFSYCTALTSITIPDSVTSIGDTAFYYCTALESVTIGNSVTSIGNDAFSHCTSLTSITIPNSVTSIGNDAFCYCTALTSITIPDGVASIESRTFYNCSSLTSIIVPDNVTSIGEGAFSGCSSLVSMTLPFVGSSADATTALSSTLFGYIFGTTSYTGGTSTEQYYESDSYTTYYIPTSLTEVTITGGSILYGVFYNCSTLTNINIPDGVTSIGNYAFYNCSSLTSINIPDGVTSIGDRAFSMCYALASVYITDLAAWCAVDFKASNSGSYYFATNPLSWGVALYINDVLVIDLEIPDAVTTINDYAFFGCGSITSVTIHSGVTSIGTCAFSNCTNLSNISVSTGNNYYKSIDGNLYTYDGTNLVQYAINQSATSFVIPDGVTKIGSGAFYGSTLARVTIADTVTSINSSAFRDCGSLTSITIPAGVTNIGYAAFDGCSLLTSVTFENSEGWYVYQPGISNITISLSNISTNASYLTDSYAKYYWHCSK